MSLFTALRDGYYSRNPRRSRKSPRSAFFSGPSRSRPTRTPSPTLIELLENRQLLTAIVQTNQDDYAPGSTAIITTSNDSGPLPNFAAGETVHFHIDRTDDIPVSAPPAIQDWDVTDGVGGFAPIRTPPASGSSPTPTAPRTATSARPGTSIPSSRVPRWS